ncbi:MAG: glycosyltransferase [Candidatus Fibromonas sp.]|jgi:glycosyltransferase involved in cell wall biosynthesis|nr:glycosyltransferase [Candidatus Fibromonas sp.]
MPFGTIKKALPCVGKRNTLSICMIVKNEEANIERAIKSFLPFADEIIVNDTGSTDKTVEIVRSFSKTVLMQSEWIGDFAYSRNLSLEKATCSWILWMDADDYVPPDQINAFNKLKLAPLDRLVSFTICNTEETGQPTGLRFMQARMFPNHPKIRFEGRIHESIIRSVSDLGLNPVNTNVIIWHTGYETLEIRQKKARRNLELQLADPEQEKRIEGLIEFGDSYAILNEIEKAADYYRRAVELPCSSAVLDLKMNAMNKLGRHLSALNRFEEAKEVYEKCMKQFPKSEEAYYGLALILLSENKKAESMVLYRKFLNMKADISSGGTNYFAMKLDALKNLSLWEFEQGNIKLSKNYAEQMLRADKDNQEAKWLFERASSALLNKNDKRPLLSLCMIVKDEEKNIGECLKSAQGLADEIIITDTGSTDKTVEIAQSYGARIEHIAWNKDFSEARNYSFSKATSRWIIWLDADDRLPKKTVEELRKKLGRETPNKVISLVVCNSANEGKTGVRFSQIRVFPNNPKIRFEGRIHEQILPSIRRLKLIEEKSSLEVFHTGYEDPAVLKKKQARNLDLFREEYPDLTKMSPNAMYHYAVSHEIIEDYENALVWFQNAMEKSKKEHYDDYFDILIPQSIAGILEYLGRTDEAMDYLDRSLKSDPYYEPSISRKALLLTRLGQSEEAVKYYGYLASLVPRVSFLPSNPMQAHANALHFLAEHWNKTGETPLAIEILKMLKNAMLGAPHNPLALAEIYVAKDKAAEALDNLNFLKKDLGDTPEFIFLYVQALALGGDVQEAIKVISRAKEKFPRDSSITELAEAMGVK